MALSTSANWAFNFALGYFVPPAFEHIKWKTYLLFGVFCIAMFVHVFFMFPETAGKHLEEVEDMFTDPSGPKYIGKLAWKTHVGEHSSRVDELLEKMRQTSHAEERPERVDQAAEKQV